MLAIFVLPWGGGVDTARSSRPGLSLMGPGPWECCPVDKSQKTYGTNPLVGEKEMRQGTRGEGRGDKGGGQGRKGESNKEAGLKEIKARNEERGGGD